MAIYHCSVKTVSRAKGSSAVASAAYRSGEKLIDHTTGEVKDYTRKSGVLATGLVFPNEFEPILIREIDREKLWNLAEINEKRKNSTVAREIEVALPNELNERDRETLVKAYCKALANVHKVAVDYAIHAPSRHGDERNYHAHILMTTRRINEQGELGAKTREWDDKVQGVETVKFWRQRWEDFTNKTLEISGIDERIDSRSLKEQGITDRQPTTHKGVARTAMERKGVEFPSEPTAEPIFEPRFEERAEIDQHAQAIDELKREITQVQQEQEEQSPERLLEKAEQAIKNAEWELAKDPDNAERQTALQKAIEKKLELEPTDDEKFSKNLANVERLSPDEFVSKYQRNIKDIENLTENKVMNIARFNQFGNAELANLGIKITEYRNQIREEELKKQNISKNLEKYIQKVETEIEELVTQKENKRTDLQNLSNMHQITRENSFLGGIRTKLIKKDKFQKSLNDKWIEYRDTVFNPAVTKKTKQIADAKKTDSDFNRSISACDKYIESQNQLLKQLEVKATPYFLKELEKEHLTFATALIRCNLREYVNKHLIRLNNPKNELYHATRRVYQLNIDNMEKVLSSSEKEIKDIQNLPIKDRLAKEINPRFKVFACVADTNKKIKSIQEINANFHKEYSKFDELIAKLPPKQQEQFNAKLEDICRRTEKLEPAEEYQQRMTALKQFNAQMDKIVNPPSRSHSREIGGRSI